MYKYTTTTARLTREFVAAGQSAYQNGLLATVTDILLSLQNSPNNFYVLVESRTAFNGIWCNEDVLPRHGPASCINLGLVSTHCTAKQDVVRAGVDSPAYWC